MREVFKDWGKANITLIFKKVKKEESENHKPVSLDPWEGDVAANTGKNIPGT